MRRPPPSLPATCAFPSVPCDGSLRAKEDRSKGKQEASLNRTKFGELTVSFLKTSLEQE